MGTATLVEDQANRSSQSGTIRVLLADDHFIVRRGLKALLDAEPRCEVLGEASTGREVVEKTVSLKPNVVVLDARMPELNGVEATRRIRKEAPDSQVLVLTMHDSEYLVLELLRAGALGYVLKTDAARDLVLAVESVSQGRPFFTSPVARLVLQGYLNSVPDDLQSPPALSPRQREVVQLLAEGRSNKEVACTLRISLKTAERHRANVMRALNLRSICELVHYAVRQNIIEA